MAKRTWHNFVMSTFTRFYRDIPLKEFDNVKLADILQAIYDDSEFDFEIFSDYNFVNYALPNIKHSTASVNIDPLLENEELGKRYLAVCIGLLGRLGFIVEAVWPEAVVSTDPNEFSKLTLESCIDNSNPPCARLLVSIMRSLWITGFSSVVKEIYNTINTAIVNDTNHFPAETIAWYKQFALNMHNDHCHIETETKIHRCTSLKEKLSHIDVPGGRHQPYTSNGRTVRLCEHGVYLRPHTDLETQQHARVCFIKSITPNNPLACSVNG